MSVADKITRLSLARIDIQNAIRAKGVSVDNADGFEDFASKIGSLASSPNGISNIDFGTITISSAFTTTPQTFTHKLGVVPDLMIVWTPSNIATTYSMLAAIRGNQFGWRSSYNNHMAYHANSTTTVTWTNSNSTTYGISSMTAEGFNLAGASASYAWREGTYNYIAIKFS